MSLQSLLSAGLFAAFASVVAADASCSATTIFYNAPTDLSVSIASIASSYNICNNTATSATATSTANACAMTTVPIPSTLPLCASSLTFGTSDAAVNAPCSTFLLQAVSTGNSGGKYIGLDPWIWGAGFDWENTPWMAAVSDPNRATKFYMLSDNSLRTDAIVGTSGFSATSNVLTYIAGTSDWANDDIGFFTTLPGRMRYDSQIRASIDAQNMVSLGWNNGESLYTYDEGPNPGGIPVAYQLGSPAANNAPMLFQAVCSTTVPTPPSTFIRPSIEICDSWCLSLYTTATFTSNGACTCDMTQVTSAKCSTFGLQIICGSTTYANQYLTAPTSGTLTISSAAPTSGSGFLNVLGQWQIGPQVLTVSQANSGGVATLQTQYIRADDTPVVCAIDSKSGAYTCSVLGVPANLFACAGGTVQITSNATIAGCDLVYVQATPMCTPLCRTS